jgi:hypothetical protein
MGILGEARLPGETSVAFGFWHVLGPFSLAGEFASVGGAKVRDLEGQDRVAAAVIIPQGGQNSA